ncbi:MAG: hypothetical protein GY838_19985 [bacterium]|nr:hypothetical protein [bacterium]
MDGRWVEAATFRNGNGADMWKVDHSGHPLLDPAFPSRRSRLLLLTRQAYRRALSSEDAYREELVRLFHPLRSPRGVGESLPALAARSAEYLTEADVYIDSLVDLLPSETRNAVRILDTVRSSGDMRELLGLTFEGASDRECYEARRKLCLAQLLLRIDQSRLVQDGLRHLRFLEGLLGEGLWRHTRQVNELTVGYHLAEDRHHISYTSRPREGDQRWEFRSTFLEKKQGDRSVSLDILYHNCRFKRSVNPVSFEIVDGRHRVIEQVRWGDMKTQSSGSLLSKMIRKGINNPDEVGDIIGAMFIVADNDALNDLLTLLDSCLGSPFGWRNVTDTLSPETVGGSELNSWSSKEYKVFKGDVDILARAPLSGTLYRFPVEIQIYTLEGFLRTVCGAHDASHLALKLRQFLYGLVPRVFPREIYGEDWLDPGTTRSSIESEAK